ncbi:unnamed protein product [Rotaria magnacalcarata]|uniref:Uncharacterized protein n=1 Tax=Rotaria magnacalcarata TaxID=392030 RepID=A0A816CBW6_9BILA|nr:unnamed protein product [Rotaria magnacalcarata]CAF1620835.1 unnamed protein product [Rotaria magnacalcarata]CAF3828955.1 unnamed protein product [Rotaria magnacalcarata]CAF3840404.1 unnamed protein product [Rotaria magnacalcarata]
MATFKRRIDTSLLPVDILSYTDADFYNVAKNFIGESATELLEIQSIRGPDSLLLIADVFGILNIKCTILNPLKEKICLKSDDDAYIVKPGIKSSMDYFCELIMKKQDESMKLSRKENRRYSHINSSINSDLTITNITKSYQQQLSSSSIATVIQSPSNMCVNENYHRNFIVKSINHWCQNYSFKIPLIEGVDYHLLISSTNDMNFTARIKCGCNSKITLVKIRKNFQLSNFYKHLLSISCTTIKKSNKTVTLNNNLANNIELNVSDDGILCEIADHIKRRASCDIAKRKRIH